MTISRIGRYQVERELGRGAMAVVYKAADPLIARVVAIKTIRVEGGTGMEQEQLRQRLYREAQSAGSLSHPNIVTIYDIGQEGELSYIAMEYVDGETLENWMSQHPVPPLEQTLAIIEQIASGLAYAAARGITHRDIKPGNILLDSEHRVKIADFGIAKVSMSKMTQTGMIMGTPSYMSPEQAMGQELDGRSDLFSLGVIFYELLTGERPFTGTNPTTIIYKILHEDPVPPKALNVTLHPGLDYIVRKMLSKDPGQRYQSCAELTQDIRNYSNLGAPPKIEAPAASRSRWRIPVFAISVLLGIGGYLAYTRLQPATRAPASAETPAAPVAETPASPQTPAPAKEPEPQPQAPVTPEHDPAPPAAATVESPPPVPAEPPAPVQKLPGRVLFSYSGEAYPVSVYEGRRKVRDIAAAAALELPAGDHRLRLVGEEVFLNLQLDRFSLEPEQERLIALPGLSSAYIEVPNDAYEGCEILLNGTTLPTPYPAQVPKLAAGSQTLLFRWSAGKYAGLEFTATFSSDPGHHYLVAGDPERQAVAARQVR